jgi:hypothetical protein
MKDPIAVYLETGRKRVFAGAIHWPGWSRSGRDRDAAIDALLEYGARYAAAVASARLGFEPPAASRSLDVVETLEGNATTDFGAPGVAPALDARPLDATELKRQDRILRTCWRAFDRAAEQARGATLSTGPRGGGRSLAKIVAHVLEADGAYLHRLGGRYRGHDPAELREVFLETLASRAKGEEPPKGRRTAPLWFPRYAVRRSAWHALDHAWEIEDRAGKGRGGTRRT